MLASNLLNIAFPACATWRDASSASSLCFASFKRGPWRLLYPGPVYPLPYDPRALVNLWNAGIPHGTVLVTTWQCSHGSLHWCISSATNRHFDLCMTCWYYLATLKEIPASQKRSVRARSTAFFPAAAIASRMPTWRPCCLDCSRATSWASSRFSLLSLRFLVLGDGWRGGGSHP